MKWFKLPYNIAAPGALIGASNFFELAVAVAITGFDFWQDRYVTIGVLWS